MPSGLQMIGLMKPYRMSAEAFSRKKHSFFPPVPPILGVSGSQALISV